MDVVFRLLGNSTEDLFFPGNYLVVEGGSDQAICEAVLSLLDVRKGRVKVIAAGGVHKIDRAIEAITTALRPLVLQDSPYSESVVALTDKPRQESDLDGLRRLGDRLFVLDAPSLEEYLPDAIYRRAGHVKSEVLQQLNRLQSYSDRRDYKADIAKQVSAVLERQDLESIPTITEAVRSAAERAT
jgi:hypothetical protein